MPHPPSFWAAGGGTLLPALLSPAAAVTAWITRRRMARPGWRATVPVFCAGNAGVGGAGKTILALDLAARLSASGLSPHFLTRGHGGRLRGPVLADPARHGAYEVGDEALLLCRQAPTWVGADRAASARLAIAAGADMLVMDDGLQNPGLAKTASLLVIDGAAGFGNGRVLPAGPLREPAEQAARRCLACVLIGPDDTAALRSLPASMPVLRARLAPGPGIAALQARPVLAFAGIGRPQKFFGMLSAAGLTVSHAVPFPDHHPYSARDLSRLARQARQAGAWLVTTPKDHVRLDPAWQQEVVAIGVSLAWEDECQIEALIGRVLSSNKHQ